MTGGDRSAEIDAAFTRFCADGSPESLATVFEAVAGSLRDEARRLVRDHVVAEDLLQSTFVAAIELRDRFDAERGGARAWLRGLLRNRALHVVRDRQVERRRAAPGFELAEAARSDDRGARHRMELVELVREVEDAVARLPEPYATAVRRVVLQGESPQRIAEETGQPPATVRSHVRRGIERLRRMLPAVASALARAMAGRGVAAVGVAAVLVIAGLVYLALAGGIDQSTPEGGARRAPLTALEGAAGREASSAAGERQLVESTQLATPPLLDPSSELRPGAGWSLVRAADRTPLADMPVLWDAGAAGSGVVRSDDAGRLATTGLPPFDALRLPWARLEVTGDEVAAAPILVPPGFRLVGQVVDAAGRAVPGAVVHWLDPDAPRAAPLILARADGAGRFEVPDLAASCVHRLVVLAPGLAPSLALGDVAFDAHEVAGSTGEVVERSFEMSALRGESTTLGADPLGVLRATSADGPAIVLDLPAGLTPDLRGWSIAFFDPGDDVVLAAGRCSAVSVDGLSGELSGPLCAVVFPPAVGTVAVGSRPLSRRPCSRRVPLLRDGDGYRLSFRTDDLPSCWLDIVTAPRDATVVVLDDAGHPTIVLERGGAVVGPLPPGRYTLAVQRPADGLWLHRGPFELREAGTRAAVAVGEIDGVAAVTFRPPPGVDARDLTIHVSAGGAPMLARPEVVDDGLTLRLVPGDYMLHWRAPGFAAHGWPLAVEPGRRNVQLAGVPGENVALEITFEPGRRPRDGRVSADLQLVDAGTGAIVWRERISESLDDRGAVLLQRRFEPGTYRLRVVERRGATGLVELRVPSDEGLRIGLR